MSKAYVRVEFAKGYYPAIWVNKNEMVGMVKPENLDNRVKLVGNTTYWFDYREEKFYFQSHSYDMFTDAVKNLTVYCF